MHNTDFEELERIFDLSLAASQNINELQGRLLGDLNDAPIRDFYQTPERTESSLDSYGQGFHYFAGTNRNNIGRAYIHDESFRSTDYDNFLRYMNMTFDSEINPEKQQIKKRDIRATDPNLPMI